MCRDPSSVMWNRMFSQEKFKTPWERHHVCGQLQRTLEMLQVRQMVVGHTPQVTQAYSPCSQSDPSCLLVLSPSRNFLTFYLTDNTILFLPSPFQTIPYFVPPMSMHRRPAFLLWPIVLCNHMHPCSGYMRPHQMGLNADLLERASSGWLEMWRHPHPLHAC